MLRAVGSIGVGGELHVPHFMKEFKGIGAVGDENSSNYVEAKPAFEYEHPELKTVEMTAEQNKLVLDGMYDVVNGGGTATSVSIGKDFPIAGKTGTAQVTELGNDKGKLKDHAWFVGFAPAYNPEISVIAIIENAGFGGSHAGPAVRGVFQAYVNPAEVDMTDGKEKEDKEKTANKTVARR
jgi:penicillin-binding protein 2